MSPGCCSVSFIRQVDRRPKVTAKALTQPCRVPKAGICSHVRSTELCLILCLGQLKLSESLRERWVQFLLTSTIVQMRMPDRKRVV